GPRPVLPSGRPVVGPPAGAEVVPDRANRAEGGRRRATPPHDGGGGGERPPRHSGGRARDRDRPRRAAGRMVGNRRPFPGRPDREGLGHGPRCEVALNDDRAGSCPGARGCYPSTSHTTTSPYCPPAAAVSPSGENAAAFSLPAPQSKARISDPARASHSRVA